MAVLKPCSALLRSDRRHTGTASGSIRFLMVAKSLPHAYFGASCQLHR